MEEAAPFHADLAEAPPPDHCAWLAAAGARVRAAVWSGGPRGVMLLFQGRTEYLEKYGRVIARLRRDGFSVAAIDWRGQGLSTRSEGVPLLGDVVDFDLYQRDVAALVGWAPVAALPGPRVLLAHSMGGCIGLRALTDARIDPAAAIFSAPMWGLSMSAPALFAARALARAMTLLGLGTVPLPGRHSRTPYVIAQGFEGNVLTTDPAHYAWFREHCAARPELHIAAPTPRWADAAFREMAALRHASPASCPTLALLGTQEAVVSPEAIRFYAERAGASLRVLQGAKHEPLMEPQDHPPGLEAWRAIEDFLQAQGV